MNLCMVLAYFHNDCSKETGGLKSYESIALKLVEDDYAWWP